ncbi:hypothetical protein ACOSQ4_003705 [Xanthoceras sorbifolium]
MYLTNKLFTDEYNLYILYEKIKSSFPSQSTSYKEHNPSQNDCSNNNPLWWLIQQCKNAVRKEWSCYLAHIYRECNGVADALAGLGHACSNSICFFDTPPLSVSHTVKRVALACEASFVPKKKKY